MKSDEKKGNPLHWAVVLSLVLGFSLNCHKEGEEDYLFLLTQAPPFISEVSPSQGSPAQSGERPYPATDVTIRGRNIADPGIQVFFNGIQATIVANLGNEIITRVPDGTVSGKVYLKKPGGDCLPNSNTGFNCSGADFFVDCYKPYGEEYGKEREVKWGESIKVEFNGVETRAFRGNLEDSLSTSSRLKITCPGPTTLRYFSPSCDINEQVLVRDPEVAVGNAKIIQFFLTTGQSECNISLQ